MSERVGNFDNILISNFRDNGHKWISTENCWTLHISNNARNKKSKIRNNE